MFFAAFAVLVACCVKEAGDGRSVLPARAVGPRLRALGAVRDRLLQRWCALAESREGKGVPPSAMAVRGAPTEEKPPARKGLAGPPHSR